MNEYQPTLLIHVLRCGGSQAAVTWDALQEQFQTIESNPQLFMVWDDGGTVIHPALQKMSRVDNDKDLVEFLLEQQQKVQSTTKTKNVRVNMFICHCDAKIRQTLHNEAVELFDSLLLKENIHISFPNVVHPTAFVSKRAMLCSLGGIFIGPHAVVHTCASVGKFSFINTAAVVEHDCIVPDFSNIDTDAILCGGVSVGTSSTDGTNAFVRDHVIVANKTTIGMQAGVVANVATKESMMLGPPAQTKLDTGGKNSSLDKTKSEGRDLRWCPSKRYDMENFERYLRPSISMGHMTNDGPLQRVLMKKLQSLCHVSNKHILMASNGTAALHALATAWEMKLGKRLIFATQSFTFPSSIQGPFANAIVVDMDTEFGGPSFKQLDGIVEEIDGVVVTNLFGHQADILKYESWCRQNQKLLLLDNAATPIGFVDDDGRRSIHEVGDGSIISLHETKPLGRGEGGAIFCDAKLQRFVHQAMNFGFNVYSPDGRIPHRYASNWRMSDIAAAAICDHIDHVIEDEWEDRMTEKARYAEELLQLKGYSFHQTLSLPTILSCLLIKFPENKKFDVDSVCAFLQRCVPKIEAKRYYRPLGSRESTFLAWELFDNSICLPFHIEIEKEMVEYEIQMLTQALSLYEMDG